MENDSKDMKPSFKRGLEPVDGPAKKKTKDDGEDRVAFKILIPAIAVGAIIGKGGESMRNLKQEHHCTVSMSKSGETYPGTNERICLIRGSISNCVSVLRVLSEKIHEKCRDAQMVDYDALDFGSTNRGTEMKIVMPNTSAGLVIGKAGANIKEIRESYDVNIQVHPKAGTMEAKTSAERVVVIAQESQEKLIQAAESILHKVALDPHHAKEIDREQEFGGGKMGAPARPHSPYQGFNTASSSIGIPGGYGYSAPYNAPTQPAGPPSSGQRFSFNPATMSNSELLAFLDQLQVTLRESGFNEAAITEVMSALHVLAKYNIMALGLGFGVVAMAQMRTSQAPPSIGAAQNQGAAGFGGEFPAGQNFWKR